MSDLPEVVTLRRARMLWDARRANPPLSVGKRPFRCIGGPLHGATVRLDPGQSRYVAVEPRDPRAFYGADDLPDPHGNLVHYRMEKFGSVAHQMAVTVLLAENAPQGNDALPLLLDAFMPEMLTAYEVDEDA